MHNELRTVMEERQVGSQQERRRDHQHEDASCCVTANRKRAPLCVTAKGPLQPCGGELTARASQASTVTSITAACRGPCQGSHQLIPLSVPNYAFYVNAYVILGLRIRAFPHFIIDRRATPALRNCLRCSGIT